MSMKWNKKFSYTSLSRIPINGSRHYAIGQQRLPAVSTILNKTKSIEDKRHWRHGLLELVKKRVNG